MDTPSLPSQFDDLAGGDDEEQEYERIWRLLQRTDEERADSFDVDAEWDQLARRLDLGPAEGAPASTDASAPARRTNDRPPRSPDTSVTSRRWPQVLTVVALVLCLVGGGVLWWSQPVSVTTAGGARTTVSLPDGSTAELNGRTTIEYPRGFSSLPAIGSDAREVRLDGEAFFSVVEGERPFHVVTPNARVEVLGTEFDVRTHTAQDAPETTVTLSSGHVRLRSASAANDEQMSTVSLSKAGHTSRVVGTQPPTAPQTIDLKYVQAWRDGGFAIQNAALPTVLGELERRFGTPLALNVPASTTDPMTLHYAADVQLKDVLRDICVIQGLSFRETSRGYELVRD